MKNNMKKIIYMLTLGILFLASYGQASAAWNTYPSDCPNPLSIGNYTTKEGIQDGSNGCWTRKTVSADAGQTINVAVYYDNTNNADANNTTINLTQSPAGSMTSKNSSYSFSGNLGSSVGSLSLSQVRANLSSSETLTFSQAKWYKKASNSGISLPSGQTGYEAFNGGLDMGTIAKGDWGTILFSFTIGKAVQPPSTCTIDSFTASPSSITSGSSSLLNWNTTNCTSVSISPNIGNVAVDGSYSVSPTNTTIYTLTAVGSDGGIQTKSVTVVANSVVVPSCLINNFTASPTYITSGGSSLLAWNTSNCTNVIISNLGYSVPLSGSQTVWPTYTTTYILTASDASGTLQTRTVIVSVDNNNNNNTCSIDYFSASPTYITSGGSSVLNWNTSNCTNVTISNLGYNVPISGSQTVWPTYTTTYVLTATGSYGSIQTRTVTISVDNNNNNYNNCSIDYFSASPTYITSGGSSVLNWNTSNCTNVYISGLGNVSLDGSRTVYPYTTTTYTLGATNNSTVRSQSVTISVNNIIQPIYNSNVVTTVATNISQTGAQLNGLVTNSSYISTSTYFEYGTSVNLGMRTSSRSTSGNTNFSDFVTNLSPNTIYYFRAAADGSNGIARGTIEVFRTLPYDNTNTNTTNTRIIRQVVYQQGNTVSGSLSPIVLRIENRYQNIGVGDTIDYTVFYKNISSSTLTHPMVQVYIPQGMTFTNSSAGTYSQENRTLSVPLADLIPNAEGNIYLQARVDSLDTNAAQIVTTAVLVYTNPNGAQENAMAYVLNNPKVNGSVLGASAFFGGMFGMSLIGWLLLIILIMLLILLSRSYRNRRNTVATTTQKTIS
jgi:hypothetical protein